MDADRYRDRGESRCRRIVRPFTRDGVPDLCSTPRLRHQSSAARRTSLGVRKCETSDEHRDESVCMGLAQWLDAIPASEEAAA